MANRIFRGERFSTFRRIEFITSRNVDGARILNPNTLYIIPQIVDKHLRNQTRRDGMERRASVNTSFDEKKKREGSSHKLYSRYRGL